MRASEAEPPVHVRLIGLRKTFGTAVAVEDFSLDIGRGTFTTLLGPSGSGKTTVLRMLAGFVEPDAGGVLIGGIDQTGRPPNLRGTGMVFQDYALFPHMTVQANVEYGLRMQRIDKRVRRERVQSALELLGLTDLAERFPHELSGGQQQRVALGRVIVLEPQVLLMDEPLSNLDAKLRVRLRAELKELQRQLGITTVYVTHDQEEALSLSDQVVVIDKGRMQQVGAPEDIYRRPANRFVAEFVGQANVLPVEASATGHGEGSTADDEAPGPTARGGVATPTTSEPQDRAAKEATVWAAAAGRRLLVRLPDARRPDAGSTGTALVRPEHVRLAHPRSAGGATGTGSWQCAAKVVSRGFFGAYARYWLELDGVPDPWLADVPISALDGAGSHAFAPGAAVTVSLDVGAACWLW
ncbi:MAG TPA: ABC transporter ATP-binding protein [Trueperaceae bacterium]|jgi:ABC-type Fe3+/spermidine/putrescine transport system ATPase subunit|nr:ABC transporter ATP-binding protein [Trueperaceae bacterium]